MLIQLASEISTTKWLFPVRVDVWLHFSALEEISAISSCWLNRVISFYMNFFYLTLYRQRCVCEQVCVSVCVCVCVFIKENLRSRRRKPTEPTHWWPCSVCILALFLVKQSVLLGSPGLQPSAYSHQPSELGNLVLSLAEGKIAWLLLQGTCMVGSCMVVC